jgi:uncharacterized membrane protein YfcA
VTIGASGTHPLGPHLGHYGGIPNTVVRVAVLMGVASALGVLVGAALVPYADRHIIKAALGVILLRATIRLTVGDPR